MSNRDDFISLVKPPGYEVSGHTRSYQLSTLRTDLSSERVRTLASILGEGLGRWTLEWLQNVVIETRLDEALLIVAQRIDPALEGYLLRINSYVDAEEIPHLATNIVSFIGSGRSPLDALARSLEHPSLGTSPPLGMRAVPTYRWCTVEGEQAKVTCADVALSEQLDRAAKLELLRRRVEVAGLGLMPQATVQIQHTESVRKWATDLVRKIQSDERRQQILSLATQYAAAENAFNQAYRDFQETAQQEDARAREAAMLGRISQVIGLARTGIQVSNELTRPTASGSSWNRGQQDALLDRMAGYRDAFETERLRLLELGRQFSAQATEFSITIDVLEFPREMEGPLKLPAVNRYDLP